MIVAVFYGDTPLGLRISPDQQQAPQMLPPHLSSALGTSATDTGLCLYFFSFTLSVLFKIHLLQCYCSCIQWKACFSNLLPRDHVLK
jgi:hypothetical protein